MLKAFKKARSVDSRPSLGFSEVRQFIPEILLRFEQLCELPSDLYGVVLHGSFARDSACEESDIDLLVQVEDASGKSSRYVFEVADRVVDIGVNTWETLYNELKLNRHSTFIHILASSKVIRDVGHNTMAIVELAKSIDRVGPVLTKNEAEAIIQTLLSLNRTVTRVVLADDASRASFTIDATLFLLFDFESKIAGYFASAKPAQLFKVIKDRSPKIAPRFVQAANPRLSLRVRLEVLLFIMDDQACRLQKLMESGTRIIE